MRNRDVLDRLDAHMARGNDLMEQIREEFALNRREHQLNRAAFHENRDVIRAVAAEIRQSTATLKDIQDGIKAQNEGLHRVLSKLDDDRSG